MPVLVNALRRMLIANREIGVLGGTDGRKERRQECLRYQMRRDGWGIADREMALRGIGGARDSLARRAACAACECYGKC